MNFRPVVKAVGVTLCMAAISAPFAQQGQGTPAPAAARLVAIEGDALASTESGLVAVNQGAPFSDGTRVMTMTKSKATIQYADGCIVKLEPNMRVEIRLGIPCAERQKLATLTVPDPATQLALEGGLSTPGNIPGLVLTGDAGALAGFVGGAAGLAVIVGNRPSDNPGSPPGAPVSPN